MDTKTIIQLILALVAVAPDICNKLMDQARRTSEMTPDEWTALRTRIDDELSTAAWKTTQGGVPPFDPTGGANG